MAADIEFDSRPPAPSAPSGGRWLLRGAAPATPHFCPLPGTTVPSCTCIVGEDPTAQTDLGNDGAVWACRACGQHWLARRIGVLHAYWHQISEREARRRVKRAERSK